MKNTNKVTLITPLNRRPVRAQIALHMTNLALTTRIPPDVLVDEVLLSYLENGAIPAKYDVVLRYSPIPITVLDRIGQIVNHYKEDAIFEYIDSALEVAS